MKVKLQEVRISFPQLFNPQAFEQNTPKYNATFLFGAGSQNAKVLDAAVQQVAKGLWGEKTEQIFKSLRTNNKMLVRDGDDKEHLDGYTGQLFIKASNISRPTVLHKDKTPLTEQDGVIYGGCYVNAVIDVYAFEKSGIRGVFAKLLGVQFVRDGDSFSGAAKIAEDDFDDLSTEEADDLA